MRLRGLIAAGALGALTACGGPHADGAANGAEANAAGMNEQQLAQAEHRAPDAQKVLAERWQALFAAPDKAVAAARDLRYPVGDYAAKGAGFAAQSDVLTEPGTPDAPATVKTNVAFTGDRADHLTSIVFTFDTHVAGSPTSAKVQDVLGFPRQLIGGFLQRFEVGAGDPVIAALTQFDSASWRDHGVAISVAATPGKAAGRTADQHLTVTITQTQAPATTA